MFKLIKVKPALLKKLREEYLSELPESQELFLELFIRKGEYYIFEFEDKPAGYVILNEKIIYEYHTKKEFYSYRKELFDSVITKLNSESIFVKSFDYNLMNCCLLHNYKYSVDGFLFREYKKKGKDKRRTKYRLADKDDLQSIIMVNDTFFENEDEVDYFLRKKNLYLFYNKEILIGVGLIHKINEYGNFCDIGMLVNPDFRKKGYGTEIISVLVDICKLNGMIPVCGCGVDNIASKKTLEKAGFINNYLMLNFKVG